MAAGTSALLMLVGGGVVGVATWPGDGPAIVTAGPDELAEPAVPDGVSDGVAAPESSPPARDADQPIAPDPHRAPGIAVGVDPETPGGHSRTPAAIEPTPKLTTTPKAKSATVHDSGTKSTGPPSSAPHPVTKPARQPVAAAARPVITTRTEVETQAIPFPTQLVRDPALPRGSQNVRAEGKTGVRSLRYLITLTDGKRTDRRLLDTTVTKLPERRLIAIGVGRDRDQDTGDDRDDQFDCGPGGHEDDLCLPFGRSATTCTESAGPDKDDSAGAGAGVIVLGDSVIDNEDVGLPDGYNWAC